MMKDILGKKESQKLEFKGRDALTDPKKIGREVVAMLNAGAGSIFIGVGEKDGVAVTLEPITHPDRAIRELLDHLVDTLEPAPSAEELSIKQIAVEGGGAIIQVKVTSDDARKPYAQLIKSEGRVFVTRVGDRIRPLSRDEIGERFCKKHDQEAKEQEKEKTIEADMIQERLDYWRLHDEGLWFLIRPVEELEIDLNEDTKRLLLDPSRSKNRMVGWTFATDVFPPKRHRDVIKIEHGNFKAEIRKDGGLHLIEELQVLWWRDHEKEINPWALLELPTSFMRLASVVFERHLDEKSEVKVLADFALIGVRGCWLKPGSPDSPRFAIWKPEPYTRRENVTLMRPFRCTVKEIVEEPDYLAFRIIQLVYEEFGIEEKDIPMVYNRQSRKLVMPT